MTEREKPVSTKEVAEFVGVAPSTVEDWRQKGKGPAFMRIGNRCLYMMSDVHSWLLEQRQQPATDQVAEQAAQEELDERETTARESLEKTEHEPQSWKW